MNFEEVEYFLTNIKSVISSKVIVDSNNEICEIHVLSDNSRHSKQIARDIRTALLSKFNIDVDYKIISVAQIDKNLSFNSDFRLLYEGYTNETTSDRISIKTKFTWEGKEFFGEAEGVKSEKQSLLVAARSVLDAIRQAVDIDCFIVEDIQYSRIIGEEIVIIAVNEICNGKENILIGASIIENNKIDAVIKATLNAINRKICLLIKD
ncbi:MAG: hypothetical protein GX289_09945 [Tissierellia bacterium]|nr:hypothetical protein [Tissierellia bacterium]